jgi:predicted nuclease of predicted toxin-antitoxin system
MKFKIDENLHADHAALLAQHGHDALTVHDQGLTGRDDAHVAQVCQLEQRALVTLDLDFADIRIYPPAQYSGIIVIRAADQSKKAVSAILARAVPLLASEPLIGKLWIVDEHHVRIRGA